jgi:hypothetical protein
LSIDFESVGFVAGRFGEVAREIVFVRRRGWWGGELGTCLVAHAVRSISILKRWAVFDDDLLETCTTPLFFMLFIFVCRLYEAANTCRRVLLVSPVTRPHNSAVRIGQHRLYIIESD